MKLVKIDKKKWSAGLTAAADTYRLFGPVKEKDYHQFKELEAGENLPGGARVHLCERPDGRPL